MREERIFNHPLFPLFADRYRVCTDGTVVNIRSGRMLSLHQSNSRFLRLTGAGSKCMSICLNKLLLLTFKGEKYRPGAIAICIDGDKNNSFLDNLKWGSRKTQSEITMENIIEQQRVRLMGRKYGKIYGIAGSVQGRINLDKHQEHLKQLKQKIKSA